MLIYRSMMATVLLLFCLPLVPYAAQTNIDIETCSDGNAPMPGEVLRVGDIDLQVADAVLGVDTDAGDPVLTVRLTELSQRVFGEFTANHAGEVVDVTLGDTVLMSPRVNEPIWGGVMQISRESEAELQAIMARIRPHCGS